MNKALRATHSRREADRLVDAGRVTVNGVAATSGDRLVRGDAVRLDGELVDWERLNPPPEGGGGGLGGGCERGHQRESRRGRHRGARPLQALAQRG